jgi:hypothetical protein
VADNTLLDRLHRELAWPVAQTILSPEGTGAAIYASLAREKLGSALARLVKDGQVRVGVLVVDHSSSETSPPLAIVCEFSRPASQESIKEAHRLAWNFCRAPLLITIDPYELRSWSCFVAPRQFMGTYTADHAEIRDLRVDLSVPSLTEQATQSLGWLTLISGDILKKYPTYFEPEGRADRTLLENLKEVRRRLILGPKGVGVDLAHDLIARLMFVQFLSDRKDASGRSALSGEQLERLCKTKVLARRHKNISELLADHDDAYRLFRWLNKKFNGDFFPAKGKSVQDNELAWKNEKQKVSAQHLALLADFVSGALELKNGQLSLWRLYSFDAIPLEFVSSIYEEFVKNGADTKLGVHYTPSHLVDFLLDAVLPWDGEETDIKILDPACGSGIFLVRAFQRLAYRWKSTHNFQAVPARILRQFLTRCLYGIDLDEHAARVASFSLYLAMCDEIDPRRYWTGVKFPTLRGRTIVVSDFFSEGVDGFDSNKDGNRYDIVIGNAPWGKNTATTPAKRWAKKNNWPISNLDVGPLFLSKALALTKSEGRVAMVQPAGTLLLNRRKAALQIRSRLLAEAQVEEIVNYTILRFHLFPTASSPACSITLKKVPPSGSPFFYICPKLQYSGEDYFRIVTDKHDVHSVYTEEVIDPSVWTVLMIGGRRDLRLIRRVSARARTLAAAKREGAVEMQEGLIPSQAGKVHPELRNRLFLETDDFPAGTWLRLKAFSLPRARTIHVHRQTNAAVFSLPQLVIKQGWREERGRFRSALIEGTEGVVCTQSYITVHAKTDKAKEDLASACLMTNSRLAAYYLALTSSRLAFIPEVLAEDFYELPLPPLRRDNMDSLGSEAELDTWIEGAFGLADVDRVLIEDALKFGVPELLRDEAAPGRLATWRKAEDPDPLTEYSEYFLRVVRAAAGRGFASATVFQDSRSYAPLRMVAIHLSSNDQKIKTEKVDSSCLSDRIAALHRIFAERQPGGMGAQRVGTILDSVIDATGQQIPTAYFIKPNQMRYWTRAVALGDADSLLAGGFLLPEKREMSQLGENSLA